MSLWVDKLNRVYNVKEITDEEMLILAEKSGTFNLLNNKEEDIYTRFDGQSINILVDKLQEAN